MILVANHASHADTAAIIAALPPRVRRRLAPAAAEDYFFSSRAKGVAVEILTGGFPFPRHGADGLARACRLLAQGWSVLVFPEGTRSRDGEIGHFKRGVAKLATLGYPVVAVGLAGTRDVLPAGACVPRRGSAQVVFAGPECFDPPAATPGTAADIEARVRSAAAEAVRLRPRTTRTWHQRAAGIATSRAGVAIAFCWGVAEAVAFPIVPDLAVALLALAAPRRFALLAGAAAAGSVAGGALAYGLGAVFGSGFLAHAPLVTDRMAVAASEWLANEEASGLAHQTWSGVPFKVFGWQAAGHDVSFWPYLARTVLARAPRILLAGGVFGVLGAVLDRWIDRLYGAAAASFTAVLAVGLANVVAHWS